MTTSGTATPDTCKECAEPRKELRVYDADVVDYLNAAQSASTASPRSRHV